MSDHAAHITRLCLAALLSCGLYTAHAQDIDLRTVEENGDRIVVELTADWPLSMSTVVDSAGISSLTPEAAQALSFGVPITSGTYELDAFEKPRLSVLESSYDQIDLAGADSAVVAELAGPVAFLDYLGYYRGRPTVNLVVRLLSYDGGAVRRYNRIRVALHKPTRGVGKAVARTEAAAENGHLEVTESVLSSGVIYKFPITAEGVYRIDRSFIANLPGLNMSPDDVDPANVRIFGNGGSPVPALNSAPRPVDLVENAVQRIGGGDGAFNEGDAVIFYGKGPKGWVHDGESWKHYVHPYSNENFYFLKIDDAEGASVGSGSYPGYGDAEVVDQVTGRFFRDFDEFIWSKENGTGHTWVSTTIRPGGSRQLIENAQLPGFAGGTVNYEVRVAIRSNPVATVLFESGGTQIGQERATRVVAGGAEHPAAIPSTTTFSQQLSSGSPANLSMRFSSGASGSPEAAADWVRVLYPQTLSASGDSLRFATPAGVTGRLQMTLSGFSAEPHVWDVTDHSAIRRLGVQRDGDAYRIQLEVYDPLQPREILAFLPQNAHRLVPASAQRVENQNLHGIASYPDFVIVTPDDFRSVADDFAQYRREDGLEVLVANVNAIYNEFSGGLQDVRGIRDYLRFLYDRAPVDGRRLKYALLFGDGHFNYRNLGSEVQQPELANWIPPYETEDSFDPRTSYTSDDYFALLDADEGRWPWPGSSFGVGTEKVDIGVGRFPAQTAEEAAAIVAKIKHYEDPETYGPWRTRYLFVADDGYNEIRPVLEPRPDLHTQNSDVVAELMDVEAPAFNIRKVYGISYTREPLPSGWRIPGAERDIQAALNDGVLVMNYSGHGGEVSLAQEELLTKEDALAMRNFDKLPIFVTATCSFGWWDLGKDQSAAESLLLNPQGGAIALMTTVRLVYTDASLNTLNVGLNRALTTAMFKTDDQGLPRRLGDALVEAKNTYAGLQGNNRKFNLLGDPTMRIGMPSREAAVEKVNDQPIEEQPRLRALEEVTVEGFVRGTGGDVDAGFNGQAYVTVFDAEREVKLPYQYAMPRDYYVVREDLIWRGTVPVNSGRFEATFVVPKDISYSDEPGRISVYAHNGDAQALGFTENTIVGGTAANPPDDHVGPDITLFLNDTTFVSGGMTPRDPRLIVKLRDDSGINTVGAGVGHEMLLVVDGDEQNAVDISSSFESDPDSYRSGQVTYSFDEYPVELADGPHTLSVRAWDVVNNSNTSALDFYVSSAEDLVLQNVYNYPNPTSGHTRFLFEHNQPTGTAAEIQVRIYTLAGRPIRTIDTEEALPSGILTAGPVQIPWDGRDEDLNLLASGIYLYKVRVAVESMDGERHVSERIEKLAIIR